MPENALPRFVSLDDIFGPASATEGLASRALGERVGAQPIALERPTRDRAEEEFVIPSVRSAGRTSVYAQTAGVAAGFGEQLFRYLDELGCDLDAFERGLARTGYRPEDLNRRDVWEEDSFYPSFFGAFVDASAVYVPSDDRRPDTVSVDARREVFAIAREYRERAEHEREPELASWYAAVAEAMDRVAPKLDPTRWSLALGSGPLAPDAADAVVAFANSFSDSFELISAANPTLVPWDKEFALFGQIEYLKRTAADARERGTETLGNELVEEGLRRQDMFLLLKWANDNNAEARRQLESAGREADAERAERETPPERDPLIVEVDPRNLGKGPARGASEEGDEGDERQKARRQANNRLLAVSSEIIAESQSETPRVPTPTTVPARRSGLPPAPGRGDLGR